jgi:hypothetical protein
MTERNFTLYRLAVVSAWPPSEERAAVLAGIRSRLATLPVEKAATVPLPP